MAFESKNKRASKNEDKLLEILSKHFKSAYKWLIFCKAKNVDWCIANTIRIEREATQLKKLFFKQIKRKRKKSKSLMRKCEVRILYFKQYGHQDIRTAKYFKKLIRYILKIEDYHSDEGSDSDD